jgi:hypothetical protein
MKTLRTFWFVLSLSVAGVLAPLEAQAQLNRDPDPVTVIVDGAVARPAGAAVTVVGAAAFIATLPFAVISKSTKNTWNSLVVRPAKFTFRRPMGEFEQDF